MNTTESKNQLNTALPTLLSCVATDLLPGNFVINISREYVWQLDNHDAAIVNSGALNGKKNVQAIICNSCKVAKATQEVNRKDYRCSSWSEIC